MYKMKKERDKRRSVKKNIGFYIALGICLTAVAGAAWSTYGSVEDYINITESQQEESEGVEADREVSGEKYESQDTAESSETESSEESKKPVPEISKEEMSEITSSKPVENGEVIKGFSPEKLVRSETMQDWRTHRGTDISAEQGKSVHAVLSGKVTRSYTDPLYGNVMEIESAEKTVVVYCGLTETSIAKVGEAVHAGETIGYVGKIPSEEKDPSHIHLEAKKNGKYIDVTTLYSK